MLSQNELKQLRDDPNLTEEDLNLLSKDELQQLNNLADSSDIEQPTEMYGKMKEFQSKAAEAIGNFPQRVKEAVYNSKLPLGVKVAAKVIESTPMAKVAKFATSTLPKAAIEHPKESLTAGGAMAMMPFTAGLSGAGVVPALIAALGVGSGAALGNLVAQGGEQLLKSPDRQEAPGGVAKEALSVGGGVAATELAGLGALKVIGKVPGKIKDLVDLVKTARLKPNIQEAEKALEISNMALGQIRKDAKIGDILPQDIPSPEGVGKYATKLREEIKDVKNWSTELLEQRRKEIKSFFQGNPLLKKDYPGVSLAQDAEKIKTELGNRIPGLAEEVAKNRLAREASKTEIKNTAAQISASKKLKRLAIATSLGGGILVAGPKKIAKTIINAILE